MTEPIDKVMRELAENIPPSAIDRSMDTSIDKEKIAKWICVLNTWNWPDDMPGKPENWDILPNWYGISDERRGIELTKKDIISPLIKLLRCLTTEKDVSRWWHINIIGNTNEQFEKWFDENKLVT